MLDALVEENIRRDLWDGWMAEAWNAGMKRAFAEIQESLRGESYYKFWKREEPERFK